MSKYTIEKHGKGYAIYLGRDWQHHGANIGHLTEVTPTTIKLIEDKLNATLAQPEQKLIGWNDGEPQYVAQPKPWVGLTIDESSELYNKNYDLYATDMTIGDFLMIQREIEAKLKEKNT